MNRIRAFRAVAARSVAFGLACGIAIGASAAVGCTPYEPMNPAASAADGEKSYTVSKKAYEHLRDIREALADEKYDDALEELGRMNERKYLNDYERALMWQLYSATYASQGKLSKAAESLQKALDLDALPETAELDAKYNLGQLYLVTEKYDQSGTLLADWLEKAENPKPDAYYITATAFAQGGKYRRALHYALLAVEKVDEPTEAWLQLVLSLHFELGQHEKVAVVLKRLIEMSPEKTPYWKQLSAVYSELGDTARALAVMELTHKNGMLDDEEELLKLARLYLNQGLPLKAAKVLEDGIETDVIAKTADTMDLLASSWIAAREHTKAVSVLEEAAPLAPDGGLFVQLAQTHAQNEQWTKARQAIRAALKKGNLKQPGTAYLLLGTSSYNAGRKGEAFNAFIQAKKDDGTKKAALQWLAVLKKEQELCKRGIGPNCERAAPSDEDEVELATTVEKEEVDPAKAKFAGRFRLAMAPAQARAIVRKAVEAAIAEMSAAARAIAERRLDRGNRVTKNVTIEVRSTRITIKLDAYRFSSRPGRYKSITSPNGEAAQMVQRFRGGNLEQTFTNENGTIRNVFSLSGDGKTLSRTVTITSPQLSKPIVFRLSYVRG